MIIFLFIKHWLESTPITYISEPQDKWAASSEFGTYRLCEQRRFRRDCASAQSRQNLRCSLIQAVSQEEPSDRKPDPWPLWMAGHTQLKFIMTECSKTQIRLTGLKWQLYIWKVTLVVMGYYGCWLDIQLPRWTSWQSKSWSAARTGYI